VAAIHAKIANARKDYLHKASTALVRENKLIVVGNVEGRSLPYRAQRKSALDASWSTFRTMLRYKAIAHGATCIEADEQLSSASCSACGAQRAGRHESLANKRVGLRWLQCST
jgi:IS605 OrfB family transposase